MWVGLDLNPESAVTIPTSREEKKGVEERFFDDGTFPVEDALRGAQAN